MTIFSFSKTGSWISILAFIILSFSFSISFAENTEKPFKIGILPYLSPEKLMSRYSPLINYVGQSMHRKPLPETAPNFPTYVKRAANYQFDLYVTAPHFAALAESQLGYKRIARLTRELDGAMVVHKDSDITQIEQLKGKTLATPDHLAIITILGELALQDHGLSPGKDIKIISAPSHNTALLEVVSKRADAAVVSAAVYESMDPKIKKQLRLIFTTQRVPHMMFLASPKISESDYETLKKAVLDYKAKGAGAEFFNESGYIDMEPISDSDMDKMKAMLPLLTPRLQ